MTTLLMRAAPAACPNDATIAAYLEDFKVARPSGAILGGMSRSDAECARSRLVKALPQVLGRKVGYKAGFTNPAVRARLGVDGPAWGVMFDGQLVESGARIPVHFGARLHYEADLVVVVKDRGLADADTAIEALRHLSAVVPFIELPDTMSVEPLSGIDAIARNIAFRGGVLGRRVVVEPTQAFLDALGGMTVVMSDAGSRKELSRAQGDAVMGHPIQAAMWLAVALRDAGMALQAGDLLSLGAYTALAPVAAGSAVTVRYVGLPGNPSVAVYFEE